VIRGEGVPTKIVQGDPMRVRIIRVGAAAAAFRADAAALARLSAAAPKYGAEKDPGPKAHFDDPDKLLPTDQPRAQYLNFKLNNVERATGTRIRVRLFARFAAGPGAATPHEFTDALARSLGGDGVLAVYFADRDAWYLSLGSSGAALFLGSSGDPSDSGFQAALLRSEAAFLELSRKKAAQESAKASTNLPGILQPDAQKVKASLDAVLGGLIAKIIRPQ
jgi:hypothetical protein